MALDPQSIVLITKTTQTTIVHLPKSLHLDQIGDQDVGRIGRAPGGPPNGGTGGGIHVQPYQRVAMPGHHTTMVRLRRSLVYSIGRRWEARIPHPGSPRMHRNLLTLYREGGEAPFYATVVPSSGVPGARIQNISIPTGPVHSFRLDQAAGLSYVIVMSDATGFGSGGVTPVLTSGPSADTSCIGPMVGFDFYFYLTPSTAQQQAQCAPLRVTWDASITYPLQLLAVVPGSAAFSIPVPQTANETSVVWDLAVREGAEYQLLMANAGLYGTGGATDLVTVRPGSSGCLADDSPGQGSNQATVVASITAVPSTSITAPNSSNTRSSTSTMRSGGDGSETDKERESGGTNAGAIAGGVVGGVFALALLLLLAFCYRRKRRQQQQQQVYRDTDMGISAAAPMRQPSMMQTAVTRSRSSFDILGRSGGPPSPPLPPASVDQEDPFVSPYPAHERPSADHNSATGAIGAASQLGRAQAHEQGHFSPTRSSLDLPPIPGERGHQRIASMDTLGTGVGPSSGRASRKVSGTFGETAPQSGTFRNSYADAMSQGTGAGTLGHGHGPDSPMRASQRLSRARWSMDELGQMGMGNVPEPMEPGRGSEDRRVIQHRDAEADGDVL